MDNAHYARGSLVEVVAQTVLEEGVLNDRVDLRNADLIDERADRARSIAASAQTAEGRHTRVVPAADVVFLDKSAEFSLGHNGVVDAQTREFDLTRLARRGDVLDDPVVKRTVILKLERAEGVGDILDRVLDRVRKVVHRVNAPAVARAVVVHAVDSVDNGVAHVEVARGKVDFRAESHASVGKFARSHSLEQVKAFLNRSVAEGAFRGGGGVAAVLAHLFGGKFADIGKTLFNQLDGEVIHLLEVL